MVRQAIAAGRFQRPEDAVAEALRLWEDCELRRLEFLASLDEADASLEREEGIVITRDAMRTLADDVKRRGREQLAAQRQSLPRLQCIGSSRAPVPISTKYGSTSRATAAAKPSQIG